MTTPAETHDAFPDPNSPLAQAKSAALASVLGAEPPDFDPALFRALDPVRTVVELRQREPGAGEPALVERGSLATLAAKYGWLFDQSDLHIVESPLLARATSTYHTAVGLGAQRDQARSEVTRLEALLYGLRRLEVTNDPGEAAQLRAKFAGEAVREFAALVCEWFRQQGGVNFVEVIVVDPRDHRQFVLTMQARSGKSAAELRSEALEEAVALRERVAELEDALRAAGLSLPGEDGQ